VVFVLFGFLFFCFAFVWGVFLCFCSPPIFFEPLKVPGGSCVGGPKVGAGANLLTLVRPEEIREILLVGGRGRFPSGMKGSERSDLDKPSEKPKTPSPDKERRVDPRGKSAFSGGIC